MSARRVVCSTGHNVWRNLTLEEHLIKQADPRETVLYLWRNRPAVVIGRHQNPWTECCPELLRRYGVLLARRISGGGAVFHDLGNLNFTFITSREAYDLPGQVSVIRDAVRALGVDAQLSPRNDLLLDGKKVSGNASRLGKAVACHHGTLLVDADLARLATCLRASTADISSKATESVRSSVANLTDALPKLTVDAVVAAVVRTFAGSFGAVERIDPEALPELDPLEAKHESWEWRLGKTPRFEADCAHAFSWGTARARLAVAHGLIEGCELHVDGIDSAAAAALGQHLIGRKFWLRDTGAELAGAESAAGKVGPARAAAVDPLAGSQARVIAEDLAHWLASE